MHPPRIRRFLIFRTVPTCRYPGRCWIMCTSARIIRSTEQNTRSFRIPRDNTLVADVSSCFLSEPVDVTKYGVIYGGVQKNVGPAGVVIVIIREDLITEDVLPGTPTMLKYKTHADADSLIQHTAVLRHLYLRQGIQVVKEDGRSFRDEGAQRGKGEDPL